MKRIFTLLIVIGIFSLVSCGPTEEVSETTNVVVTDSLMVDSNTLIINVDSTVLDTLN